jgi:uracil permease
VVTIAEHIADMFLLSDIMGRDLVKEPGLHRTLIGDGGASIIAGFIGGPANTTYGENVGVVGLTKIASVWVIGGTAVIAIILGFITPFAQIISTIPLAVMGGVGILLFGIIASCGVRVLVKSQIDFANQRNLIIGSVIMVIGVGLRNGLDIGEFNISGMALAAIVGIVIHLVLPNKQVSYSR